MVTDDSALLHARLKDKDERIARLLKEIGDLTAAVHLPRAPRCPSCRTPLDVLCPDCFHTGGH